MTSRRNWAAGLGALLVCLLALPAWAAEDTVNIVQIEPISGIMKSMGDLNVMGVQFAIDEINASGGLLGKKVKHLPEDSQLKPDVAARKATKAIMTDGAQFIFQLTSTAIAQALMDVAEKNKVIYLNLGAESDFLTGAKFNGALMDGVTWTDGAKCREGSTGTCKK